MGRDKRWDEVWDRTGQGKESAYPGKEDTVVGAVTGDRLPVSLSYRSFHVIHFLDDYL